MSAGCAVTQDLSRYLLAMDEEDSKYDTETQIANNVYSEMQDLLLTYSRREEAVELISEILEDVDWNDICYQILASYQTNHYSCDNWRNFLKPFINKKIDELTRMAIEKEKAIGKEDRELGDFYDQ